MSHRIGIIGAGSRGIDCFGKLIKAHKNAELVALCDINSVRAEEASKKLGGTYNLYQDPSEMLSNESLDAVIVTSPDYCHADHTCLALEKDVAVMVDKPLATTVKDCQRIIEYSQKYNTPATIGFNLRHNDTLQELKRIIDSDELGRIFLIENREFYDGGRTYMARWNRFYEKSGGLWVHKGSHDFDVFQWLLGFPKPVRVMASAAIDVLNQEGIPFPLDEGKPAGPTCSRCAYLDQCPDKKPLPNDSMWTDRAQSEDHYSKDECIYLSEKDVHDNGLSIVEYDNGVRASHMECFVTSMTDRLYTVIGTKGQAEVSLENRTITIRPRWGSETKTITVPVSQGGHGGADPNFVNAFIASLDNSCKLDSTLEHGLLSTAVGEAAEIASREKRSVLIKELMGTVKNYMKI